MVKKIVWMLVVLCCGFVSAGERAVQKDSVQKGSPTQKDDATQKNAYQKGNSVEVHLGWRGRRAARLGYRASLAVCRSGNCR